MPLLSLWASNPETISSFTLLQVVSAAGDGELKDGSLCSDEIREYFTKVSTAKLAAYIDQCLAQPLVKGGYILQDLVNELGRRLDYSVENGRYSGTSAHVGFDGLWSVEGQSSVIVEVKTTDAYRISLDTLASYREKLVARDKCTSDSSILIIVGRQDTGDLEAQIRGSRHAWDIRLISAEALLRLVEVKDSAGQPDTDEKIRGLLRPTEYTRLDDLVDVVFSATKDVETLADVGGLRSSTSEDAGESSEKSAYGFTPAEQLNAKRTQILASWQRRTGFDLSSKSKALFLNAAADHRVVCTLSKRYHKLPNRPYWYAYHPAWRDFLNEGRNGFLLLGAMDLNLAFGIPSSALEAVLPNLNTTFKPDHKTYWHLHILEDAIGNFALYVPGDEALPLEPFAFSVD